MTIGDRIKEARIQKGLVKQAYLADALELKGIKTKQQSVSNWERDVSYPNVRELLIVAEVLEKPVTWFFQDYTNSDSINNKNETHQSAKTTIYSVSEILPKMDMKEKLKLLSLLVSDISKNLNEGNDEPLADQKDEVLRMEREKLEEAKKQTQLLGQVAIGMVRLEAGMKALSTEMKETKGHVLGMGENLQKTGDNLQYLYDMAQTEGADRQPGIDIIDRSRQ